MKTKVPSIPDEEQQEILEQLSVRIVHKAEYPRYEQYMNEFHYLKHAQPVGEQLRYAICYQGEWLALFTWQAVSYHLKDRENWVGWSKIQRQKRLPFVVNNSRFLILPQWRIPNLASRSMRLALDRLSSDWKAKYGHGVLLAETFVDPEFFKGTVINVAGGFLWD